MATKIDGQEFGSFSKLFKVPKVFYPGQPNENCGKHCKEIEDFEIKIEACHISLPLKQKIFPKIGKYK